MSVNAEFVERYQLELAKDPKSRVFAPLAEAYRKMGLLEEAKRICDKGTRFHPDFAGGHVAYAKVLVDLKDHASALPHLEKAARLSPDNILAHTLMGETLLQLRRPKDALKAFKMVLFLNPEDAKAQEAVRKWEFLTADEYDEAMFDMKPGFTPVAVESVPRSNASKKPALTPEEELEEILEEVTSPGNSSRAKDSRLELAQRHARALDRAVSLADAFTIRNDLEAALKVVEDAIRLLGSHPELDRRATLLNRRLQVLNDPEQEEFDGGHFASPDEDEPGPLLTSMDDEDEPSTGVLELDVAPDPRVEKRRGQLETLLRRISERRG